MDYCSSCRRHLNGALACPGCGAYAPDIAPPVQIHATTGAAVWEEAPTWHEAGRYEEPVPGADPAGTEDVADAPVATEGRAARRRQRARWRKSQRKAVVATAVALVGGGLTVTAMSQQSNGRPQAATSPDNRAMGGAEVPTSDDSLPTADTPGEAHQAATKTPGTKVSSHRGTAGSASTSGRSSIHTDSAATPTPTATTASRSQSKASLSASVAATADTGTTTSTTTEQTPSSTATDSGTTATDSGTGTSTGSGSSQTSETTTPSSSATDPAGLCVLNLLCIS
ncbi:hypothetical protein [Streptomyces sp. SID13726]|uniref:SCO2400 family protein n=1 Tax=Streptomyces sp. SID13726 TaxID=2706058 RepID=UPI0013BD4072|nr:hypothetical protein [Streptomyces sp. SID13726]NEB03385.1 hypothetical protein [Streptomyces sp. SID13726]